MKSIIDVRLGSNSEPRGAGEKAAQTFSDPALRSRKNSPSIVVDQAGGAISAFTNVAVADGARCVVELGVIDRRDAQTEDASTSRPIRQGDAAPLRFGGTARDRQSEPGTADVRRVRLSPIEWLEDSVSLSGRNTRATIRHREHQPRSFLERLTSRSRCPEANTSRRSR